MRSSHARNTSKVRSGVREGAAGFVALAVTVMVSGRVAQLLSCWMLRMLCSGHGDDAGGGAEECGQNQ
jgi:hypothetical protein